MLLVDEMFADIFQHIISHLFGFLVPEVSNALQQSFETWGTQSKNKSATKSENSFIYNVECSCKPKEVVGLAVCAFAGWALWDGQASETGAGRAGLCALAVWAAVLTLGATAALAGAVRGSASLLAAAFALLALSAVAEAAAAWWGAAHAPQLEQALRERLRHTVLHEYGVLPARTHMLDAIQQGLQCCGADGARDWQRAAWARGGGGGGGALDLSVRAPPQHYRVPASCCAAAAGDGEGAGAACEAARRVAAGAGAGAGLHGAGCAARALAALRAGARGPLAAAAALLAAHAAALLLALALCLRARPAHGYKA